MKRLMKRRLCRIELGVDSCLAPTARLSCSPTLALFPPSLSRSFTRAVRVTALSPPIYNGKRRYDIVVSRLRTCEQVCHNIARPIRTPKVPYPPPDTRHGQPGSSRCAAKEREGCKRSSLDPGVSSLELRVELTSQEREDTGVRRRCVALLKSMRRSGRLFSCNAAMQHCC